MQIASGSMFIKRYMCIQYNINEPVIDIGFGKNININSTGEKNTSLFNTSAYYKKTR